MAENVGSIYYTVEAETDALLKGSQGVDKSLGDMDKSLKRTDASAKKADLTMKGLSREIHNLGRSSAALSTVDYAFLGIAAAAGTAALALGKIALSTAKTLDETSKFAQQIGVTTEGLTGLQFAAQQFANISNEQFSMALRRMTRRIAEAAAGSGAASNTLKELGLNAQSLTKMTPDQQFLRFADAIKRTDDQGKRLQHTMALFDTEGMGLVPALQQGSAALQEGIELAARFGVVLSQDTAQAAEDLMTNLGRLRSVKEGLYQEIASRLIPTFVEWTGSLSEAAAESMNMERIVDNVFTTVQVGAIAATAGLARYTGALVIAGAQTVIKATRAQAAAAAELVNARAHEQTTRAALAQITAMRSLGATQAQITAATNAQAAAQTRLAAATTAAGAASRGLLAVLGGPAGIAITAGLAAVAILGIRNSAQEAKQPVDLLAEALDTLGSKTLKLRQIQLTEAIDEMKALEGQVSIATHRVEYLTRQLEQFPSSKEAANWRREIAELHSEIENGNAKLGAYQERLLAVNAALAERNRLEQEGGAEDPPADDNKYLASLREQAELARVTGVARAKLAAIQRLGADATEEERQEAERLATEIYNLESSRKANTASTKSEIDVTKQNAEAIERLSQELHLASLEGIELAEARALQALNQFATPEEIARVRELSQAIYEVSQAEALRAELRAVDPLVREQDRYAEELESLRALNEAKLLENERYLELKMFAEQEHAETMAELREQEFIKQSEWNEILMGTLDKLQEATTEAITGLVTGASTGTQALQMLGKAILNDVVSSFVRMGIEHVRAIIMGRVAQTAAGAAYAAATAAQVKATTALAGQAAFASTAAIPIIGPSLAPAAAAAAIGAAGALGAPAIAASALAGKRQYGGPVEAARMYRVNEDGRPEVLNMANGQQFLIPNARGEVVSNRDAEASMSQTASNVTDYAPDNRRVTQIVINGDLFSKKQVRELITQIIEVQDSGAARFIMRVN